MDGALIVGAGLLGLGGSAHCAVMCAAPCVGAVGSSAPGPTAAFQLARLAGYALGGAVAAASVSALGRWSQWAPAVRPVWLAVQMAALLLGLWLLITGRQPAWLQSQVSAPATGVVRWLPAPGTARSLTTGMLWVAWPCGLLQSALLLAGLASSPWTGAAAMAAFGIASAPALLAGPWLWRRWMAVERGRIKSVARRASGAVLAASAAWASGHGVWDQAQAWCLSVLS
jgi:sulfite exporter TauE/SafE